MSYQALKKFRILSKALYWKDNYMFEELNKLLCTMSFKSSVGMQDRLAEELGFDSLKIIELIVRAEEIYSIEIDETDLDPSKLKTVKDLFELIKKYYK